MSKYIIETEALTKVYSSAAAVDNVSMRVSKGCVYGLLGRNGAGKTSIMKMLLTLTRPTSGTIQIFGKELKQYDKSILSRIGSAVEAPAFYPELSAADNLYVFSRLRGAKNSDIIKNALSVVDLPYDSKKCFREFSLGMKQRLAIANAVMFDPELLILDEPTNGLDPIGIAEIRELILNLAKDKSKTILISSHQLSEIQLIADEIGIIDKGRLLEEGTVDFLRQRESRKVIIRTEQTEKALKLLKEICSGSLLLTDNRITISNALCDTAKINYELNRSGIMISEIYIEEKSLEEHFKEITGGVGIG